jgi:hypothetical protein
MVWPRVTMKSPHLHQSATLAGWLLDCWRLSAALVVACLATVQARAQPSTKPFVDLKYEIDPAIQGCPTMLEFRSIVARELGYDPYLAESATGLSVRVRPNETGIEAVINWRVDTKKKARERHFAARTEECRAMMTTVGFVAAVQIQLMADEESAEQPPPPPHTAASPSGSRSDSAPSVRLEQASVELRMQSLELRAPPAAIGPEWTVLVGIGPSAGAGLGPGPIGLGRFFGAVQRDWASLELGAEVSLPSTTRQPYGGGFRQQLVLGTLAGCAWHGPISACLLGKMGRIQAQGVGVDVPRNPKGLLAEAGPRVAYALELGEHLLLLAHVDGLCSLTSWNVYLNHVVVWTMPRFAGVAGIDLTARFR